MAIVFTMTVTLNQHCCQHVLSDYQKLEDHHCVNANHGMHDTLLKAKVACSNDADCFGTYDQRCDDNGPFRLCNLSGKDIKTSGTKSCIYVKQYTGNNNNMLNNNIQVYVSAYILLLIIA